jgi:hypothetical protein
MLEITATACTAAVLGGRTGAGDLARPANNRIEPTQPEEYQPGDTAQFIPNLP